MEVYEFEIILSGDRFFSEEELNALYEAGCDDSSPTMIDGMLFISFDREAESMDRAVLSAIEDIKKSGVPQKVLKIVKEIESPEIRGALGLSC